MKEIVFFIVAFICILHAQGQTFSEWFHQKKTQIKYLTQQILALQAYKNELQHGYEFTARGLTEVDDLKTTDLQLHQAHFASARIVNPAIRQDPRINSIYDLCGKSRLLARSFYTQAIGLAKTGHDWTSLGEWLMTRIDEETGNITGVLEEYLSDGVWELSDADRLARIDHLYRTTQNIYRGIFGLVNSMTTKLPEGPL